MLLLMPMVTMMLVHERTYQSIYYHMYIHEGKYLVRVQISPSASETRLSRKIAFYLPSSIFYLLSSILYLLSFILYLLSFIFYLLSSIFYLLSFIFYLLSTIYYLLHAIIVHLSLTYTLHHFITVINSRTVDRIIIFLLCICIL